MSVIKGSQDIGEQTTLGFTMSSVVSLITPVEVGVMSSLTDPWFVVRRGGHRLLLGLWDIDAFPWLAFLALLGRLSRKHRLKNLVLRGAVRGRLETGGLHVS